MLAAAACSARARLFLRRHVSFATFQYRNHDILPSASLSPAGILTRKRNLRTDSRHDSANDGFQPEKRFPDYQNRRGEEMRFDRKPPPEHIFVDVGNHFITRRCRELAPNLIAVHEPKSRKDLFAKHLGHFVPNDVHAKVKEEYQIRRAEVERWLWNTIGRQLPGIPFSAKEKFYRHILEEKEGCVAKKTLYPYENVALRFLLGNRTSHAQGKKKLMKLTKERKRAEQILTLWRGKNTGKGSGTKMRVKKYYSRNERKPIKKL
ncbi:hypothetical protein DM02DRAFT_627507 [Periconia macrospinosa]|uniref:Uncharacterized protein n=1 Tax=Periconia macrospinosa TaxID=97972 RepID=A0A2V1DU75_9PLEO|nr:hypothetical protein DM02DRAFT_627507 [Periconia macrospinosa]